MTLSHYLVSLWTVVVWLALVVAVSLLLGALWVRVLGRGNQYRG